MNLQTLTKVITTRIDGIAVESTMISSDGITWYMAPTDSPLARLGHAIGNIDILTHYNPDASRRVAYRAIQHINGRGNYSPASAGARTKRRNGAKRRADKVAARESHIIDRWRGGAVDYEQTAKDLH